MTGTTCDKANGRWREILGGLGFQGDLLNGKHHPCPMCGGTDRFRFTDRNGDGDYFCSQCGAGKGFKLVMAWRGWDFREAATQVDTIIGTLPEKPLRPKSPAAPQPPSRTLLNNVWNAGHVITPSCVAGKYLTGRGLDLLDALKGALRGVDYCLHHPSKTRLPALLARFSDPEGKPQQLHRTYLTEEATKAPVKPCRMWMPGDLAKGGAIRLGPAAREMGVAEGVETALAASKLFGLPVWATTSEGLLREWRAPKEAMRVTVFADHDRNHVGQRAAEDLAWLLFRQGVEVEVKVPPKPGTDWNDVLLTS
jgi:putative DNA primase/helicase